MGILLAHQHTWLTPLIYPHLPRAGVDALGAFSEWVYEYTSAFKRGGASRGSPATHAHQIHPTRRDCPLPQAALLRQWAGYQAPDGTLRDRALQRGLAELLTHGVVRATYRTDPVTGEAEGHPTYTHLGWIEPALACAVAVRDVTAHLGSHPIDVVLIDGVAPDARPLHGAGRRERLFERTVEAHQPAGADHAAALMLRKVSLEWVGHLGDRQHPEWTPDGFTLADLLYDAVTDATGVDVARSAVPRMLYVQSRPVVSDELLELLPALRHLPDRMRATPSEARESSPTAPTPQRKATQGKSAMWAAIEQLGAA